MSSSNSPKMLTKYTHKVIITQKKINMVKKREDYS